MIIVSYSSYTHINQEPFLNKASRVKSEVVEASQVSANYGKGLSTLLIFYNFEVIPNEFAETDYLQKKFEIQRYNSKEQSLRVNIFVGYEELTSKSYEDQIKFYYKTTIRALEMVKDKFSKRKIPNFSLDFGKLYQDIQQGYLKAFPWLK